MRTRVKICGITNRADLDAAVAAGADAVGLNMYAESPRHVDAAGARELAASTPPFVTIVGLFANHDANTVKALCEQVDFDLLQFHGDETDAFCASFGRRFIKALRVAPGADIAAAAASYPRSAGLLLDAYVDGLYGGSGTSFDWDAVPALHRPVILAGGLDAGNVADAIRRLRPYGVDVSTGVEASPGKKDTGKIESFIAAVRAADGDQL